MISTRFILRFICLVFILFATTLAKENGSALPKIDYETLSKNNFEFLKQNQLVVIAVGNFESLENPQTLSNKNVEFKRINFLKS
jgi:hypothetical protein